MSRKKAGHVAPWQRPIGGSVARSETRLLRYLLNGLELVELMAGCASGTHGKDMDSSGMLISALRHGFTCDAFTAKMDEYVYSAHVPPP